ncbi:MAG: hypothetical protein DRQ49_14695 [Gammaproteobacteria bacterium]|nr:MAG: hypothetical protein DRQ49_14695 [Gammaproteobacteria bacterium]RKZ71116.1 MAG: hypothetical protein DRQ57_19075 [Gammaproteobacteria bacterium]
MDITTSQPNIDLAKKLFEIFKTDISNAYIANATERAKILVALSAVAWNYTITKDDDSLINVVEHFKNHFPSNILEDLLTKFIKKKSELFSHDKRLITKCLVSPKDNEFSLTVNSTQFGLK